VSPEYISEQAPKRIRGGVTTFNQLMVVSGILCAYLVNLALGDAWRWMLALAVIPGAALAIGMLFMPSSPRWLIEQGREDEAREVLARSRSDEEIDDEVRGVREAAEREGGVRDLASPQIRPILATGLALAIFQQFIGVNTIIYYAPTILQATGLDASGAILRTVSIGITNVVFTVVAVLLIDKVGRRALLLTGTAVCIAALAVLGLFFASSAVQDAVPWLALICLIVYIAGFAIGLGPVFWLMISEIFPLRVRGPAMATSTVANWLSTSSSAPPSSPSWRPSRARARSGSTPASACSPSRSSSNAFPKPKTAASKTSRASSDPAPTMTSRTPTTAHGTPRRCQPSARIVEHDRGKLGRRQTW